MKETIEKINRRNIEMLQTIEWLEPQENDLYRIRVNGVKSVKFEKLDENGEVTDSFEHSLNDLMKMRAISFMEIDMLCAMININAFCPDLMYRILEKGVEYSESLRKKKEANEIYITQDENWGMKN